MSLLDYLDRGFLASFFRSYRWGGGARCLRCFSGMVMMHGRLHERVNHSEMEYARGDVHINNCEYRASLLMPWLSKHRGV